MPCDLLPIRLGHAREVCKQVPKAIDLGLCADRNAKPVCIIALARDVLPRSQGVVVCAALVTGAGVCSRCPSMGGL